MGGVEQFTWFSPGHVRLEQIRLPIPPHASTARSKQYRGVRTDSSDVVSPIVDAWFYFFVWETLWIAGYDVTTEVGCQFRTESGSGSGDRLF